MISTSAFITFGVIVSIGMYFGSLLVGSSSPLDSKEKRDKVFVKILRIGSVVVFCTFLLGGFINWLNSSPYDYDYTGVAHGKTRVQMWDDYHEDTLVIFLEPGKIARIEYYLYKKGSEYQTSTINEIGSFGYEGCAYSMQDELGEIYNSMKDVEFSKIYQDKEAFDGAKYVVIKNFTPFDVQIEYTYKEYVEE